MGLHELSLRNFRLFQEITFQPDHDGVTVLSSANGTGKTSILEAVHALATASSFRTGAAGDMIKSGSDVAEVHGVLFQRERRVQVDLTLTRGLRTTTKRMLVNGQRPGSRAELSAVLPLTVFTPEGVDIVRQGPEGRRGFLTNLLTDVDVGTGDTIERFHRVLSQRNALLRNLRGASPTFAERSEIEVWSSDFCTVSKQLVSLRETTVNELAPLVALFYGELSGHDEDVTVRYEQSWSGDLAVALQLAFSDDQYRGHTTVGPHRDDLGLSLDGRDARRQASQGEQRSLALALRLAGHELVRSHRNLDPLLLLDDVFSELDPMRSTRLLQLMPSGQTLVTTASSLPAGLNPASIIDLARVAS